MITRGQDVRQIINELADYIQATPDGVGGFTGTLGSVPYVGVGGTLTEDNANLFWHSSYKGLQIGAGNYPDTNFKLLVFGNENAGVGMYVVNESGGSGAFTTVNLAGLISMNGYPADFSIGTPNKAANSGTLEVLAAGGLALSATHTNGAVSIFAGGAQEVNRIVKVTKNDVTIKANGFESVFRSNGSFTINSPSPHVWFQFTAPTGQPAALGLVTSQASQQSEIHFETNGNTWRVAHTGNSGSNLGTNAFAFTNAGSVVAGWDTDGHMIIGMNTAPEANLHIKAGDNVYAPLKIEEGGLLDSPLKGCFEFSNGVLYFTTDNVQRAIAFEP